MLREILDNSRYSFYEGFEDWRDAIRCSYKPLLKEKIVNDSYVESVIKSVEEYGPYIVIVKNIAMPHSSIGDKNCSDTAISYMHVNNPVKFDENDGEKDAILFFSLAASDNDEHVKNIERLMDVLMNEELVGELILADSEEKFKKIVDKYE